MEISKDTKLCEAYMGKYPVISISLKGINAAAYEDAFDFAVQIMQRTAEEFQFLSDSEYLSEHDKSVYRELLDSNMSETVFCGGLKILSKLLEKHYRLKVIRLTLYILKKIDKIIFKKKQTIFSVKVDNINIITMLYNIFQKSQISVKNIDIENVEDIYWKLSFFIVYDRRIILDELVNELNNSKNIISVDYLH